MSGYYLRPRHSERRLCTGALYVAGYILLFACYAPQWFAIFMAPAAAAQAVSPWFLGAITAGLALLQGALLRDRHANPALRWGNALALVNAVITDAAYLWALAQV